MIYERIEHAPSRRTLSWILAGSLVAASLIVLGVILPAEFHVDPLGFGRATGLLHLSGPREVRVQPSALAGSDAPAHFYSSPFRTDSIDIRLAAGGDPERGDELEWKVRMQVNDTLIYAWNTEAPADQFYFDFHGQSDPTPEVKVLSYREGFGNASNGALTASFAGIHGWYLQNQSEHPVVVHLKLSGFYLTRSNPYAPE